MKLRLPEQNTPAADATPNNPRKLKKLLSELPNSNMGELTRQTFIILRDLNRQTMPNKHRLENLEMIRVLSREIFNNLKKYFINRTLPLPEKSQKIVNLNQSILQELIYGYEIIAFEASNNIDTKVDDKTLSIAICRALNYLSEMLLRSSEVYEPCPNRLWFDAHQLFDFAESRKIISNVVTDKGGEHEKTTIEDSYKQLLLFILARPTTLRQRDSERVFKKLYQWSQLADIGHQVSEEQIDRAFIVRINEDKQPSYLSKCDLKDTSPFRILDPTRLVAHIKDKIEQMSHEKQKLAVGDAIPLETLQALASSWGESAKRRFSRAERHGHINVAIGLSKSAKAITDSLKKDVIVEPKTGFIRSAAEKRQDPGFTLESLPEEKSKYSGYMTHTELNDNDNNSWDMVAKGRALTDAYDKQQKLLNDEERLKQRQAQADSHWEIVNISAGGYCLRWNSDDTSKAQIGELISLQEFDANNNFEWRIGVIRWMQFTQENGLEIGVQVVSPKVTAATAQRANRPQEVPFDCLMLPGIKALQQSPSTILPSHAFKPGDKLVVRILENKLNITLGETKEHTGSFTQFTYENTEVDQRMKKQVKKEEASRKKDDFDELWSSL